MVLFWKVWTAVVLGILLLAILIELSGARKGFHGANGLFLFASGYLTLLSSPIPFIVTWLWAGFWTALKAALIGGAIYAALFALVLKAFNRIARSCSAHPRKSE